MQRKWPEDHRPRAACCTQQTGGYYTLHLDGRPAGVFGCWKRGIKETWKANGAPLSDFDLAKLMREIEAERKRREREGAKRHKEVAEDARCCGQLRRGTAGPPLLVRKQISRTAPGSTARAGSCIAVADADGEIWSLQTIDDDGGKLFMPGGRKRGCMFAIGEPSDRIVIAEGFATGASIHEATGLAVAVAFDAGNLEPVAQAIRARRPRCAASSSLRTTICETEGNPGLTRPPPQGRRRGRRPRWRCPRASSRTAES